MKIRKDNIGLFVVFLVLFVLSAFRDGHIGNDTMNYINLYDSVKEKDSFASLTNYMLRFEAGYIYLNYLTSFISKWSQTILIVTSFIIVFGYYRFIVKYSKNLMISLVMFILLRFFDSGMNVIRQAIAMAIVFKSFDYIVDKKLLKFVITVILAFLFHKSAILFLPAYWIARLQLSFRNVLILAVGTLVAYLTFNSLFAFAISLHDTYSYYENSAFFDEGKIAPLINVAIYSLFSIFLFWRIKMDSLKINTPDLIMFKFLLIGLSILVISLNFALLNRVSVYYTMFVLALVPNVLRILKNKKNKFIFTIVLLLFLVLHYLVIVIYKPEWNRILPYSFTSISNIY